MSVLEKSDAEAAAVAVKPEERVSLQQMKDAIKEVHYLNAGKSILRGEGPSHPLDVLTLCLVVYKNGFTVVGKSAPASAANYNRELGEKLAYEDAIRQSWPLFGFALRDRLNQGW